MNKEILVGVAFVILCSSVIVSVEAKGITFKDYIDPYNRYFIKYPSKWSIQSEPVHTDGNYLYEVPFTVGNDKGETLLVTEMQKASTLSLREFASIAQNDIPLVTKILNPVTCVSETVCTYYYSYMYVGQMVTFHLGADNRIFMVTATFTTNKPIGTDQFLYMENSLSVLQDAAVRY